VLIDPKRTAFGMLAKSPFLWDQAGLVLPPDDDPIAALQLLVDEMERRYKVLHAHGAKDLGDLRRQGQSPPPRIVCVCDEFMDLLLASDQRREVERQVARLGAKARAAGIHLILATQQPRREVLSALIQSNLPARVALQAATPVEARLMQCRGAERLLGKGDLLFRSLGEPQRLQAPLVAAATRDEVFRLP
jgi:DNA segregation ATPase FtsK/SpoIIIE-like protein